ncbi:MAG: DUF1254 domain-containing protein [Okeania sp. SIO2C2]|uniref:DUF1254 domain-containing protein n=1 Tax=Okeania sp. SIO2C2 TaxID=2607787 RepID=UPI0013B5B666|nr:DUF1254 domain-containing protein [Okeania sp. SIO2C2]NEP87565.1 DUF1254 domain-containing protein [Okeania sp. SIO2C2]
MKKIKHDDQATPGYNNYIPEKIMTPDIVNTRIGTLTFFDGMPDDTTVSMVFDNLDFLRGVETFLNGIPATSLEGIRLGMAEMGAEKFNQCLIFDELMDSNPLFLTGNTDTVYASVILDLKEGPTIVEIPPECGPGTVNDAFFRFVVDMGAPGPDKGNGGMYMILPPDYEGELKPTEGDEPVEVEIGGKMQAVYISQSTSYINWLILRGFLVDGKPDTSSNMFRNGLKIYPQSQAENPPAMEFIEGSKEVFNTIHANDFEFYEELNIVIQREPISMLDPELRGLFAAIGIQKDKAFEPSPRLKGILTDAVAVGNATARANWLRPRIEGARLYGEESGWCTAFVGGDYQWLKDGGLGGRFLDARTLFFYMATVNTPAMAAKNVGVGSQYAMNYTDSNGDYLYGDKSYKLTIPANPPAQDFWSVVVYDPQTRSELQTSQEFPSKNSEKAGFDESKPVTLFFGPDCPEGAENNWIQTAPGKGWFVTLRLYGPGEEWFDQTWRPGEIEPVV